MGAGSASRDRRLDRTDFVVHFTSVHIESRNLPEWSPPLASGDSAFAVLKSIAKDGVLRASLAIRDKGPTVYGGKPVCCFTEMNLASLIEYRSPGAGVYGVAIQKARLFSHGGRPVIYGLAGRFGWADREQRIIDPAILALAEQFRYVKYDPSSGTDWTHEREWRWAPPYDETWPLLDEYGYSADIPGLCLLTGEVGSPVFLVERDDEAEEIFDILASHIDQGWMCVGYCEVSRPHLHRSYVVVMERVRALTRAGTLSAHRLDTLPDECVRRLNLAEADPELVEAVQNAVARAEAVVAEEFRARRGGASFGFARVNMHTPRCPIGRALLAAGLLEVTDGSKYRVSLQLNTEDASIDLAEAACERAAEILIADLGDLFYVTSRLD